MNREDPQRIDPIVEAGLAELRAVRAPEADWERLRNQISERAVPILARRRFRRIALAARPLIPLALAASIAFTLWVGPEVMIGRSGSDPYAEVGDLDDEAAMIEAMLADLSEHEFRMIVTGRANPEALLAVAVSDP